MYGADSFCLVLQQKLGFDLCSPEDDLLMRVPVRFLQRRIVICTLGEASALPFPVFIKPVVPKQFRGAVYQSKESLAEECRGLLPAIKVFAAEPVRFTAEVRCFAMGGRVLDAAVYEGRADSAEAVRFIREVIPSVKIPEAVVVDVGFIAERGWGVIEFNAAWGAGLNGCDAGKVLPAIVAASGGVR